MRKPSIPEQLTTSNREEASSVEMRKPDTRTYSSSRDIRTPVAARSVTPDGVMVEPHEDLSSSDDSLFSDIPSEIGSDMSDEAQARSRGSDKYTRHSSHMHTNERRHPRSPLTPKLPPDPQLPTEEMRMEEMENQILGKLSMQDKPPPELFSITYQHLCQVSAAGTFYWRMSICLTTKQSWSDQMSQMSGLRTCST